jgi:hypothetical protein
MAEKWTQQSQEPIVFAVVISATVKYRHVQYRYSSCTVPSTSSYLVCTSSIIWKVVLCAIFVAPKAPGRFSWQLLAILLWDRDSWRFFFIYYLYILIFSEKVLHSKDAWKGDFLEDIIFYNGLSILCIYEHNWSLWLHVAISWKCVGRSVLCSSTVCKWRWQHKVPLF